MNLANITLHESEYHRLRAILAKVQKELRAELVLLINRSGQHVAMEGPVQDIDMTALASLAAANLAATNSLARIVGEQEFSVLYHQGDRRSIHISDLAQVYSLLVLFDRTVPLGMVRWKVKRATALLEQVFKDLMRKAGTPPAQAAGPAPVADSAAFFTDEEIEKLLSLKRNVD